MLHILLCLFDHSCLDPVNDGINQGAWIANRALNDRMHATTTTNTCYSECISGVVVLCLSCHVFSIKHAYKSNECYFHPTAHISMLVASLMHRLINDSCVYSASSTVLKITLECFGSPVCPTQWHIFMQSPSANTNNLLFFSHESQMLTSCAIGLQ